MKLNYIHKVFTSVFIVSFLLNCESSKNTSQAETDLLSKVVVSKMTLGNSSEMTLEKNKMEFVETGRGETPVNTTSKIKSEDWAELNRIVAGMDLEEFENLPAPTQERLHDGARATTITLELNDQSVYTSLPFDEGKPPAELRDLYNHLESLVNQ